LSDTPEASAPTAARRLLLARILAGGEPGLYPVRFRSEVVERYRAQPEARLIRTRSVGRVTLPGRWSLDLGIDDGPGEVTALLRDLADRLPEGERAHWLDHLAAEPGSAVFVQMQLAGSACIDDGEPEAWT
jgi:hypothetical protein